MLLKKLKLTSKHSYQLMILLIGLLLVSLFTLFYSSIQNHLQQQRSDLVYFSQGLQKRVDSYRYTTWQILDDLNTSSAQRELPSETRLQTDIFALQRPLSKTETLIFGSHDQETSALAKHLTNYMDTFWGANRGIWSVYYLNGQDNSLTAISTLPLQELMKRYQAPEIISLANTRRSEMLQQANMLDQRESFSDLRIIQTGGGAYYITLRTSFNQPGRLTSILAFDLPIDDLVAGQMQVQQLQIRNNESVGSEEQQFAGVDLSLTSFTFNISQALPSTPLMITYHLSPWAVIKMAVNDYQLPFILLLLLLTLAVIGSLMARRQMQPPVVEKDPDADLMRRINQEIITALPMGFLIYDSQQKQSVVSNELAQQLLPHLNLASMLDMSDQHNPLLLVTINNENYEIRHVQSKTLNHYRLFIIREQERELLINKKLHSAQKVLDQSHQIRRQLFEQLGDTLSGPISAMGELLTEHSTQERATLIEQLALQQIRLQRLSENILLLNQLEASTLPTPKQSLSVQKLLDLIVAPALPLIRAKGVSLIVDNQLPCDQQRVVPANLVAKLLETLLAYSVESTEWGKLKIILSSDNTDRLTCDIVDTSPGLSQGELQNSDFPFVAAVSPRSPQRTTAMDLFFCKRLAERLNGSLEISSNSGIGTHYRLQLPLPVAPSQQPSNELLLEDINLLIDIVNEDIRRIICRRLDQWGARYFSIEERYSGQTQDLMLTDDLNQLTEWGLLLTQDCAAVELNSKQRQACFNLSQHFQEALLSLIEEKLADEGAFESPPETELGGIWQQPEYHQIFKETVPQDIEKLYTELKARDFNALALTAHRLKGVFAMLNLSTGHQLCERLEANIKQSNDADIKETLSELDQQVKKLMQ